MVEGVLKTRPPLGFRGAVYPCPAVQLLVQKPARMSPFGDIFQRHSYPVTNPHPKLATNKQGIG